MLIFKHGGDSMILQWGGSLQELMVKSLKWIYQAQRMHLCLRIPIFETDRKWQEVKHNHLCQPDNGFGITQFDWYVDESPDT